MGLLSFLLGGDAGKADLATIIRGGALLIDARSPAEFQGGHLEGSVNIPHNAVSAEVPKLEADKGRPIVVYCQSGGRSAIAATALKKSGYVNVENGGAIDILRRQLEAPHG